MRLPDEYGREARTLNPKGPPITIVNDRPAIGRNKKVSIGGVVAKFKRFPASQLPIPSHLAEYRA